MQQRGHGHSQQNHESIGEMYLGINILTIAITINGNVTS